MSVLDQAFIRAYSPKERQKSTRPDQAPGVQSAPASGGVNAVPRPRQEMESGVRSQRTTAAPGKSRANIAVLTQFVETAIPATADWVVEANWPMRREEPADSQHEPPAAVEQPMPADAPPAAAVQELPAAEEPATADDVLERMTIPVSEASAAATLPAPHWRRSPRSGSPLGLKTHAAPIEPPSESWPALEVDQFNLPAIGQRLLGEHREPMRRHAEQLAAQAACGVQVVAFVGCRRAEGRSTLVACLAKLLAEMDLKLAVVDTDFQRPCLGPMLGINVQAGIEQVLRGEIALAEVLVTSLKDRFTLAPLRPRNRPVSRLATNLRGAVLFGELCQRYDLVLIDAGPYEAGTDGDDLVSWLTAIRVDAVELVYSARTGGPEQATRAWQAFAAADLKVHGMIEAFSAHPRPALRVVLA